MQSWSSPPNGNNPTTLLTYNFLFVRHEQIKHLNGKFILCLITIPYSLRSVKMGTGFFSLYQFCPNSGDFYSKLTSKNITFLLYMCSCFNRDHCGESCAPSRNSSPSQKTVKNCCPIYKKAAEDIFLKWEESSAVFAYQVCCSLRTSFCTAFYPHQRYFRRGGTKTFRSIGFAIKGCYFATAPKSAFS